VVKAWYPTAHSGWSDYIPVGEESSGESYTGQIVAGNEVVNPDFSYEFKVSQSALVGHVINFILNITSNEGSWTDTFNITVQ